MKDLRADEAEVIRMPDRGVQGGLAPVVGQVMFLPLTMMLYGLNLLARTARAVPGGQAAAQPPRIALQPPSQPRGDTGRDPPPVAAPSGWSSLSPNWKSPPLDMVRTEGTSEGPRYQPVQAQQPANVGIHEPEGREEQRRMMDNKSLQDDMLKTVRYWVSFEKRGYETVLYERTDQVYDNLTDSQFTAWKMAEFMNRLDKGRIDMPDARPGGTKISFKPYAQDGTKLGDIDADDKRYLALDWEVVGRVQRRRGWFDERKTEALEEIAEKLTPARFVRVDVGE
jgi:hypothetical protein